MSQIQIQEKKRLTLKEIAPKWNSLFLKYGPEARHDNELTLSLGINHISTQYCIVGEAHGFPNHSGGYHCGQCVGFSLFGFFDYSKRGITFMDVVKEFEDHWNEVHVE